jgi:peptidoglycan-associated lipoprotein
MSKRNITALLLGVLLVLFAAGCRKKPVPPPPPPPPPPVEQKAPPAKPSISSFVAEPSSIERGQAATLRWAVTDATDVTINQGVGAVQASGSRQVFPSNTTTYTLTASGPGGTTTASANVNVTVPQPPPPKPQPPKASFQERVQRDLQDAYFDYDRSDVREDARAVLTRNADALRAIFNDFPNESVVVEGHCDERGSAQYNLGLGDRRAQSVRDFLVQLGVSGNRLNVISFGKERPVCTEANEDCWQRNRRAHFAPAQ